MHERATDSNNLKVRFKIKFCSISLSRVDLLFDFGRAVDEVVIPELVRRILDELDERDEQSPRMWSVDNQALEQNSRNLLLQCESSLVMVSDGRMINDVTHLNGFGVGFVEEVQQCTAEVVGVDVRIAQLVSDGVQEQVTPFVVQVDRQVLQDVHMRVVDDVCHGWVLIFGAGNDLQKVNKIFFSAQLFDLTESG